MVLRHKYRRTKPLLKKNNHHQRSQHPQEHSTEPVVTGGQEMVYLKKHVINYVTISIFFSKIIADNSTPGYEFLGENEKFIRKINLMARNLQFCFTDNLTTTQNSFQELHAGLSSVIG